MVAATRVRRTEQRSKRDSLHAGVRVADVRRVLNVYGALQPSSLVRGSVQRMLRVDARACMCMVLTVDHWLSPTVC